MADTATFDDDVATKGENIYDTQLRETLEPSQRGNFVAIDVNTADYAVDKTILGAVNALEARRSNPETYIMKIGFTTAVAMGGRLSARSMKDGQ